MSASLRRMMRVAVLDWTLAIHSRRAIVLLLLFAAVSILMMYGTLSGFAAVEAQIAEGLGLPSGGSPGAMAETLWKSKGFVSAMEHLSGGSLMFADLRDRNPIVLVYALFLFNVVPLLTLLVSGSRIAGEIGSGAARYSLVRVSRGEWALGKFVGEALMLALAMGVGAMCSFAVVACRTSLADGFSMLPALIDWSLRAWVVTFAWLGIFLGLSQCVKSGGKALALGLLAMLVFSFLHVLLPRICGPLDLLTPQSVQLLMWRRSPAVLLQGVVHLSALGFLYLSLGTEVLRRRDV